MVLAMAKKPQSRLSIRIGWFLHADAEGPQAIWTVLAVIVLLVSVAVGLRPSLPPSLLRWAGTQIGTLWLGTGCQPEGSVRTIEARNHDKMALSKTGKD